MTPFAQELLEGPISGIPAKYWQAFLKIFAEGAQARSIQGKLDSIRKQVEGSEWAKNNGDEAAKFLHSLGELVKQLS